MSYATLTVEDPNPIKRYLQRRRMRDAITPLKKVGLSDPSSICILDFGGGDGQLFYGLLAEYPHISGTLYEPSQKLADEARQKLKETSICIVTTLLEMQNDSFDVVFCLEVLEHLPDALIAEVLAAIHRLVKPGGIVVIGVPQELYLPALVKGIFRITRRYGQYDARPKHILRCVAGRPPEDRPIKEIAPGFPYHHHHLGFDYRKLPAIFAATGFDVKQRYASPYDILGVGFASEIYFVLTNHKQITA